MTGTPRILRGRTAVALGAIVLALAGPGMAGPAMAQAVVSTGVGTPFELAFWQSIDSSNDPSLYESYLTRFPNGTFSEIARAKIITLRGRLAPTGGTVAAPNVPVTPAVPVVPSAQAPVAQFTVPVVQPVGPAAQPAVPQAQPAVAAVPAAPAAVTPVADPAVAATPAAPTPTPAAVASAAPSGSTLGQLLAALANSQASGEAGPAVVATPAVATTTTAPATVQTATLVSAPAPVAPRQTAVGFAMPAQPVLSPVPPVALPPSFC